jgi:hypothetical protein
MEVNRARFEGFDRSEYFQRDRAKQYAQEFLVRHLGSEVGEVDLSNGIYRVADSSCNR